MNKAALKDASTLIIVRDQSVLMGQRGAQAAFMPGKFVFPGGAVDASDADITVPGLDPVTRKRLASQSNHSPETLAAAAIRELWEETGQILGQPALWPDAPADWQDFAQTGHRPLGTGLSFFFRAVTPKGRPRRFDARFFLADVTALKSDPDDFTMAQDELSFLQWIPLANARNFDLPFITKVVLAELVGHLGRGGGPVPPPPFFRNDDEAHLVSRLDGQDLL